MTATAIALAGDEDPCERDHDCIAGDGHAGGCRFPSWHSADEALLDRLADRLKRLDTRSFTVSIESGRRYADDTDFDSGRGTHDDQLDLAAVEPTRNGPEAAEVVATPGYRPLPTGPFLDLPADRQTRGIQTHSVGGDQTRNGSEAAELAVVPVYSASLSDPFLALAADVLDDAERTHIANANRLRQLTRTATDKDGEERGFGLDERHPDVARLAALVEMLAKVEADAAKNLTRALKNHPLAPFVKAQRGVGDKQAARLLASIGDPYWNDLHGRPRTVSELWAYCGLRPGLKRTKGVRSNWSTVAKTRTWLIVESCMKQLDRQCKTDSGIADHVPGCGCSPYRIVVDERRKHTAVTHPDWTPKHSQLDGMRVASKALLRDLWSEAKRVHEEGP